MKSSTRAFLLAHICSIFFFTYLTLYFSHFSIAQGGNPEYEIIQRYRRQIEQLQQELDKANREISRLSSYIESIENPDRVMTEAPNRLQQKIYDVDRKLQELKNVSQQYRSDADIDYISQQLNEVAQSVRNISESYWRLKDYMPTPKNVSNPRNDTFDMNRISGFIQDSFRMYYSTGPGPNARLIRLSQAPAREIYKVFLEFNVIENRHPYFVTLMDSYDRPHPDMNHESITVRRNRAGKQKHLSLAPGTYTVWVGYNGVSFPSYTFIVF